MVTPPGRSCATRSSPAYPELSIEPVPRQRRKELGGSKAVRPRLSLAPLEDGPTDPLPRPVGVDEESADPGGVPRRVEQLRSPPGLRVAPEERRVAAPAAAPDDSAVGLRHEIRAVGDELAVHPEGAAERGLDLVGGVVAPREPAGGVRNQLLQNGPVVQRGRA